jgi:hypothetical protein
MPSPTVFAGEKTFGGFGKETSNGTAVAPTRFFPFTKLDVQDDPNLLIDDAVRGSMGLEYGAVPGPRLGTIGISTYLYVDVIGDMLYNLFGGYAVAAPVSTVYPHTFSLLNSGDGQPPAHTITDNNGITATVGARAYAYSCLSEVTIAGNATGLVTADAKVTSYASAPAASAPINTVTSETVIPAFKSTVTVGGSAAPNVKEWSVTISRPLQVEDTADGTPDPYAIVRTGKTVVTGKLTYVAKDESPLTALMAGTVQPIVINIDNGGLTAANRNLTLTMTNGIYDTGQLVRDTPMGWQMSFKGLMNSTDAGVSGGLAPIKAVLKNLVTTY